MRAVTCPFCDERIKSSDRVVRCRNCGEAFEPEPDDDEECEFF